MSDTTTTHTPWGFRIVVGAATVYLGIRLIQGIAWVVERLR